MIVGPIVVRLRADRRAMTGYVEAKEENEADVNGMVQPLASATSEPMITESKDR